MADPTDKPDETQDDTRKNVEYRDDDPNLAKVFPEEELEKISKKVLDDFNAAWDSSEKYRKRQAENWSIFAGELKPKEFPYAEACNAHVPFMLETLTRQQFRLSAEIFGNWECPLHYVSTNDATDDQANLVEAHSSWQFREQIRDFRRHMNRAVLRFVNEGDVTVHSSYDFSQQSNKHETLTCDEFVVPFTMTSTMPDWSDVPFKCRILFPYKHELEALKDEWNGVEKVLDTDAKWDEDPETLVSDQAAKTQGQEKDDEIRAPYKTIHYEGFMLLPGQDRQRYVKCIVHYASKTVFSLNIHEMPEWKDKARYERQVQEKQAYVATKMQHDQMTAQADQQAQAMMRAPVDTMDPMLADQHVNMLMQTLSQQEQLKANPPIPPEWMDPMGPPESQNPQEPRMVPIQFFAHGVAIEPLVGNFGLGYGRIIADYNIAGNVALSQYIDACTLSNCWGLVVSDIVTFKEKFMVKPGYVNRVTGLSMAQVKDNIMELKAPAPSDGLIRVVEMMGGYSQAAAQSPEVLSGQPGKSGETYRGMATRIDQATKQMSYLAGEFGQLLVQIGKNNMLLNSLFLNDEELFPFVDPMTKQGTMAKVTRKVYETTFTIELRSDLQFSSRQQRIQEADELMGILGAFPPLQQNPAFVYAAVVKALKAREMTGLIPTLGAPPQPPQQFMFTPAPPPPGPLGSTGKPSAETQPPATPPPSPAPPAQLQPPQHPQGPVPGPGGALPAAR
jgi:hypothetical protein